ncbi:hypothetical protein N8J89_07840 [Crossiella sp. CA-258035]|uniref:hypothetical protein n=1 Tax=Crossiella sp. CA-258035 TaxID=2981138 RepID=UPI0024BBF68E|nr:hypothetical protein [Crossiella sp. CA-258035]WHT20965.1 hypothetical protein N8J89_07840 [Crossiella sp. CA-258035]
MKRYRNTVTGEIVDAVFWSPDDPAAAVVPVATQPTTPDGPEWTSYDRSVRGHGVRTCQGCRRLVTVHRFLGDTELCVGTWVVRHADGRWSVPVLFNQFYKEAETRRGGGELSDGMRDTWPEVDR